MDVALVADGQATVAEEPGDRRSIFQRCWPSRWMVSMFCGNKDNAMFSQSDAQVSGFVGLVDTDLVRVAWPGPGPDRGDGLAQRLEHGNVVGVGGRNVHRQGHPVAVGQDVERAAPPALVDRIRSDKKGCPL